MSGDLAQGAEGQWDSGKSRLLSGSASHGTWKGRCFVNCQGQSRGFPAHWIDHGWGSSSWEDRAGAGRGEEQLGALRGKVSAGEDVHHRGQHLPGRLGSPGGDDAGVRWGDGGMEPGQRRDSSVTITFRKPGERGDMGTVGATPGCLALTRGPQETQVLNRGGSILRLFSEETCEKKRLVFFNQVFCYCLWCCF